MAWEARLIEFFQGASSFLLDYIAYIFTYLGDELFFIAFASLIYWCFSTKYGMRFISVYLFGAGANRAFKALFRRTRPYEAYESIRSIFKKTDGWSFPSGHSNSIATIGTLLSLKAKREGKYFKPTLIASIVAATLVMLTRMYLGQHYLTDVLVGGFMGVALTFCFDRIYAHIEFKVMSFWILIVPLSVLLLLVLLITGSASPDSTIIQSMAAYAAVCLGYHLQCKYINYNPRQANTIRQIIKALLGLFLTIVILFVGKLLLMQLIQEHDLLTVIFVDYCLYFVVGIWITLGSVAVFKRLNL